MGPYFSNTILAPELVPLGAVLRVGVRDDVSAPTAAEYHYPSHLVVGHFLLVPCDIRVSQFHDGVADFTIVDCVLDCSVPVAGPIT
jgi:hypothetical protein